LNFSLNGVLNEPLFELLEDALINEKIDMLSLDPLNKMHEFDEVKNREMGALVERIDDMAAATKTTILTTLHTPKNRFAEMEHGASQSARGAGAIITGVRHSLTLFGLDETEIDANGLSKKAASAYVRLTVGKSNTEAQQGVDHLYFRRAKTHVFNEHTAATLKPHRWDEKVHEDAATVARLVFELMHAQGTPQVKRADLVEYWKHVDPIRALLDPVAITKNVAAVLRDSGNKLMHVLPSGRKLYYVARHEGRNVVFTAA